MDITKKLWVTIIGFSRACLQPKRIEITSISLFLLTCFVKVHKIVLFCFDFTCTLVPLECVTIAEGFSFNTSSKSCTTTFCLWIALFTYLHMHLQPLAHADWSQAFSVAVLHICLACCQNNKGVRRPKVKQHTFPYCNHMAICRSLYTTLNTASL